jgi:hypothetical protein
MAILVEVAGKAQGNSKLPMETDTVYHNAGTFKVEDHPSTVRPAYLLLIAPVNTPIASQMGGAHIKIV